MDHFAFLAILPSLSDLNISEWPPSSEYILEEEEELKFKNLRYLSIEGDGADERSIKALVDLCPILASVALNTTYHHECVTYEGALAVLPSTLHSLKLESGYASVEPRDHLLSRFTQLRSLDLDEGCYSESIHQVLSQMPHLVEIRFGQGIISPVDFLPLVSGPTRLSSLRQITLDLELGEVGDRISCEDYKMGPKTMRGWKMSPDLADGEYYEPGYVDRLKSLIDVAQANGISIEGSVHEALEQFEDYRIEEINRAVLDLYFSDLGAKLKEIQRARTLASEAGITLPQLDLDSIDFTPLVLTEAQLPERNWFIYSLRNEAGVSEEENQTLEE